MSENIEIQEGVSVFTLRDGMIVSMFASPDKEGALRAAGLAE
jgi:hypothetical protein